MEIVTLKNTPYDGLKAYMHDTELPNRVARLAERLLDKALITATPDGEDSAGRARALPAPARETVEKAFDIAEAFFAVGTARGHFITVPADVPHGAETIVKAG